MAASSNRRRLYTSSEELAHPSSPTLELDIETNLRLLNLLESVTDEGVNLPLYVPGADTSSLGEMERDLGRMLSLRSKNSTSSDAELHASAQHQEEETFRKIGSGACGTVFAPYGTSVVVKLAKADGNEQLWNDFIMHSSIANHFSAYETEEVNITACYSFIPEGDTRYFEQHPALLQVAQPICKLPASALVTERVLPLPQATRTLLIEKYCAPRIKQQALADRANKDCLVRVYLGSMKGRSGGMFFSLRNFKLHLNQMVDLQLDVEAMAHRMATAFAIMHWAAKTDARDVEFVLGSSTKKGALAIPLSQLEKLEPYTYVGPASRKHEDFLHRTTELFVLDFNQVRSITMDESGVAQAVDAAIINDPYIPKPLQESAVEKQVWNAFVTAYLHASDVILKDQGQSQENFSLPRHFLHGLVERQRQKAQAKFIQTARLIA